MTKNVTSQPSVDNHVHRTLSAAVVQLKQAEPENAGDLLLDFLLILGTRIDAARMLGFLAVGTLRILRYRLLFGLHIEHPSIHPQEQTQEEMT